MRRHLAVAALGALLALPAQAALKVGDAAPDFTTEASLGGQAFSYSLAGQLKQGPVVLYFYPAAFTEGCTIEAHLFAEATDAFKALGASVVGVSNDNIATLNKFSVSECRSKFPVAADPDKKVIKAYDASLVPVLGYASRTSYVIAPDGKVIYTYTDLKPDKHVENTLDAVRKWRARKQ